MYIPFAIPFRMKTYTEFNLATMLRIIKFTELNISDFELYKLSYKYR